MHKEPSIRVITGGPTLARDSNKAHKNYGRYTITSRDVLFNMSAAKRPKTWQVLIMWIEDNEKWVLYPYEDALVIKMNVVSKRFDRKFGGYSLQIHPG